MYYFINYYYISDRLDLNQQYLIPKMSALPNYASIRKRLTISNI
jgi:hypothetical protein